MYMPEWLVYLIVILGSFFFGWFIGDIRKGG